jgi:hypothetical protein
MTFPSQPLPDDFHVQRIKPPKPHDKRWDNLHRNGRRKGVQNRICRDLKAGLLDAAIAAGNEIDGGGLASYLQWIAIKHPRAFCGLLGKLVPLQLTANVNAGITQVHVHSVPCGHYISHEQVEALKPSADVIELHQLGHPDSICEPANEPAN